VLNHAIFKALLFLGAGSVIHAVATREIDRMGGLLRHMPWTTVSFIIGAVAICGLPPLNGFVSEFLIYLGFFNGTISGSGAAAIGTAIAAPALALIGGLAVACFVKVVGVVFLGASRSPLPVTIHEATWAMRLPMMILSLVCLVIGIAPVAVAPLLDSAVNAWLPHGTKTASVASTAPLAWISILAAALLTVTIGVMFWYRGRLKRTTCATAATWGCGYLEPNNRMQYSASSFADTLVNFFAGVLRPERHSPHITGPFPAKPNFETHVPEAVLERIYLPLLARIYQKFLPIRRLQHGQLHLYILYTFITLILLIIFSSK
jgi:hydrogenase-4 component B